MVVFGVVNARWCVGVVVVLWVVLLHFRFRCFASGFWIAFFCRVSLRCPLFILSMLFCGGCYLVVPFLKITVTELIIETGVLPVLTNKFG